MAVNTQSIREHMEVVGADGKHVGTVDHLEGKREIKLTRTDPAANGKHHFIPVDWVDHVDLQVHLTKSGREVMSQWREAA